MPEALVGGGQHIPTPAAEVVEVEEAVGEEKLEPGEQTSVTAWVFRPGGDASLTELQHIRTLVADDENLIWIDLCNYAEPDLRTLAADLGLSRAEVLAALSSWRRPG